MQEERPNAPAGSPMVLVACLRAAAACPALPPPLPIILPTRPSETVEIEALHVAVSRLERHRRHGLLERAHLPESIGNPPTAPPRRSVRMPHRQRFTGGHEPIQLLIGGNCGRTLSQSGLRLSLRRSNRVLGSTRELPFQVRLKASSSISALRARRGFFVFVIGSRLQARRPVEPAWTVTLRLA